MRVPDDWQARARQHRRPVTAATLAVCAVVLLLMGVLGLHALRAPLPGHASAPCPPEDVVRTTKVSRGDVTVSVYNAGGAQGLANRTLNRLESAGFKPGAVGNAPGGRTLETALVYTTQKNDMRARLVALYLGGIGVRVVSDELGPGIDVYVGKHPRRFDKSAPRVLTLPDPIVSCDRG